MDDISASAYAFDTLRLISEIKFSYDLAVECLTKSCGLSIADDKTTVACASEEVADGVRKVIPKAEVGGVVKKLGIDFAVGPLSFGGCRALAGG